MRYDFILWIWIIKNKYRMLPIKAPYNSISFLNTDNSITTIKCNNP